MSTGWSARKLLLAVTGMVVAAALLLTGIGATALPRLGAYAAPATPRAGAHVVGTAAHGQPAPAKDSGLWPLPEVCFDPVLTPPKPTAKDRALLDDPKSYVVTSYAVRRGDLGPAVEGQARACDRKLWAVIHALYPAGDLALIDRFVIFDGSADDDTLGEVVPDDAGDTRWTLLVRVADVPDSTLAQTLVHELGHLISLNPTEADPSPVPKDGCQTYPTGEGCSRPGSVMDDYVDRTWASSLINRWFDIDAVADDAAREAKLKDFYHRNSASFVDEYAATDPDEDFAETFGYWCLGGPLLTPQLAAKAAFLAARPETSGMPARCRLLASSGVPDLS